ncbi:MAG: phytanoyl-CoA dioxygenase family protein [Gammaproteobacteria bacterium]
MPVNSQSVACKTISVSFSPSDLARFDEEGYLVVRQMVNRDYCDQLVSLSRDQLQRQKAPVEYEADLHYPGAPASRKETGGETIRRLLQAQARDPIITQWVNDPALQGRLRQLLGDHLAMSLSHHNCIMTKHPDFSSDTHWHQDIRYWSFQRPELVNVWLALGREYPENGGMKVIPGSHRLDIDNSQLGPEQFFQANNNKNATLIEQSIDVELNKGDVMFFHCKTLHAAGRNQSSSIKFSAVFSFHAVDNKPLENTRSSTLPELIFP